MNVRNPFLFYSVSAGLLAFFLFVVGFVVKSCFDFKARGSSTDGLVLFCSIFLALISIAFIVTFNYYYSQMTSRFDSKGVHWKTLLAAHFIPWSQVNSVELLPLRGGEKGLLISSARENFKIELAMVGDAEALKRFVAEKSGKEVMESKLLGVR